MNHRHVYMQIILHAKSEEKLGLRKKHNGTYYEAHHVLPRSLFPNWSKKKSNIVLLTAREHFFCHQLLMKIYPGSEMVFALFLMSIDKKHKTNTREYNRLKKLMAEKQSLIRHKDFEKHFNVGIFELGKNFGKIEYIPYKLKSEKTIKSSEENKFSRKKKLGHLHTEAHKEYMRNLMKGRKAPWSANSKLILGLKLYCKELDKTFCSIAEVKNFLKIKSTHFNAIIKNSKENWFEYHWKIVELPKKRQMKFL